MGLRIAGLVIGVTVLSSAAAFAAEPASHPRGVNARERHQVARIRDGVRSDEINRRELDKLRADEAGVRAEERVYRKSGDGLTPQERRDLERDLNRTSREIYRAKHN